MLQEKTTFSIPWKHAARHGWELDKDACLFKEWAIHTGEQARKWASAVLVTKYVILFDRKLYLTITFNFFLQVNMRKGRLAIPKLGKRISDVQ